MNAKIVPTLNVISCKDSDIFAIKHLEEDLMYFSLTFGSRSQSKAATSLWRRAGDALLPAKSPVRSEDRPDHTLSQ